MDDEVYDGELGDLRASDVAAMEVYPGGASVPIRFGGTGASCGAIVLWTHGALPAQASEAGAAAERPR